MQPTSDYVLVISFTKDIKNLPFVIAIFSFNLFQTFYIKQMTNAK